MKMSPLEEDIREKLVTMKVIEVSEKIFSNQTSLFPVTLSKGNKYIMVMYNNRSNAIIAEPIKT